MAKFGADHDRHLTQLYFIILVQRGLAYDGAHPVALVHSLFQLFDFDSHVDFRLVSETA